MNGEGQKNMEVVIPAIAGIQVAHNNFDYLIL